MKPVQTKQNSFFVHYLLKNKAMTCILNRFYLQYVVLSLTKVYVKYVALFYRLMSDQYDKTILNNI